MSHPARHVPAAWASKPGEVRRRFVSRLGFPLDPFQEDAFDALDEDRCVLVSAPTGSGKTLVAAYAVERALAASTKAFYTTPLKALSNQKYGELVEAYGERRVGLLTGDTAIRPDAPVVVMTTEVLRNMLLTGSDLLAGLSTVVLDEVHFLQDPYRGGVWEEVLVLSPPDITFVCLSATVNNATELGDWLRSVRGPTEVVVERRRPIVLRHHVGITGRDEPDPRLFPLMSRGHASSDSLRVDQAVRRAATTRSPGTWNGRRGPRLPFRTPRRTEIIETLGDQELLPAIVFIFSRAACDDAVGQCRRDGVRLTTRAERLAIRAMVEERVASFTDDDLAVLGYGEWLEGLEAGLASHHAGLVPAYREAVEAAFCAGLLKVVFATETLSLGINMPARTVVIERFTKFGAAGRATLTSGEYAQLTGRAGRRGLDAEGHAVVLWSPETTLADVARVAAAPPPDLRSSFRPTYNLAVNLVRRFDRPTAIEVLRRSFAQWLAAKHPTRRDILVDHLGRRLAVLEELGYVDGWSLTLPGRCLARVYHESDLLVAEALAGGVLQGAEPSVLAGVLSALVFERRRTPGHPGARPAPGRHGPPPAARRGRKGSGDRLGERRRAEVSERLAELAEHGERIRAAEEVHLVPRTRAPEPGLATAVVAWARGASFGAALDVAAGDAGEMAPGDFVRAVKQLADLVGQVSQVAPDRSTAAAAAAAVPMLVRDVVAAGTFAPSAPVEVAEP
ncbi:MAG TPA: DEAD/DEAH box helicase [Acidimicrobiales bacterium]|nr:DEAD/DEAH box helicase [Acidimicrobiales bacterium]